MRVARDGAPVVLAEESLVEVRRTREVIRGLANDTEPHYGVSTGFGALATRHIPVEHARASCSARWCARTPPVPAPRSSARWCAR